MSRSYAAWAARYLMLRQLLVSEKWADLPPALQDLRPDDTKYVLAKDLDAVLDQALEDDGLVLTNTGLLRTHPPTACAQDNACCVHRPSQHHMRDWPLQWRADTKVMERLCPNGVGHPDPDHLAHVRRRNPTEAELQAVHGCCGCCAAP